MQKMVLSITAVLAFLTVSACQVQASVLADFAGKNGLDNSSSETQTTVPDSGTSDSPETPSTDIQLQDYDGDFFSVKLPVGWKLETAGSGAGFGFHAYDPTDPDLQFFWYGELGPYFKNYEAKNFYISYDQLTGVPLLSNLSVMETPSLEACLITINDYETAYGKLTGESYDFPDIYNLSVTRTSEVYENVGSAILGGEMLTAQLTSKTGASCFGSFYGQVVDTGTYYMNGVDTAPSRMAVSVIGVIAPKDLYNSVYEVLTEAACSITFTEEYVRQSVQASEDNAQEALDRIQHQAEVNEALNNRFLEYIND